MRPLFPLAIVLVLAAAAAGQGVPPRFGVLHNPDLYKQDTPQEALAAVLGAIDRERYDYLAAHLLDPEWVDGRLAATRAYYDRVAAATDGEGRGGHGLKLERGWDTVLDIPAIRTNVTRRRRGEVRTRPGTIRPWSVER